MPPLTSPPPTILIVEDEPSIASALTRLFTRDGYQTEVARNGQEALTACQRQAYTQILCDLWMPVLDGQGFYEALHRCQPQLCARVVFLTGDTLTPAVQAFLAGTQVPLVHKPFTAERLRALLSERCPSPQPAGEVRTAGTCARTPTTRARAAQHALSRLPS
jgi:CheY-like chemotaxis protein